MNLLHLVDPGAPGGGACMLRLLAELRAGMPDARHDVVVLGSRAHADLARRCGVEVIGTIAPPLGRPALAARPLGRAVRALGAARSGGAGGGYDVVHAWTQAAAHAALIACPGRRLVATLPSGPIDAFGARVFARRLAGRPMPLLVPSGAVEREYRAAGVGGDGFVVFPPAVDPAAIDGAMRERRRRGWGARADAFVVGVFSEPPAGVDAHVIANALIRLALAERAVLGIVHPRATRRAATERWVAQTGHTGILAADDDVAEPWRVVAGLDAALVVGRAADGPAGAGRGWPPAWLARRVAPAGDGGWRPPRPGVMPLLWAMAGGLPVVAEDAPDVRAVLDDGACGLLVAPGDPNAACAALLRLRDEPELAARLGARARARVDERFGTGDWCRRVRDVYAHVREGRSLPPRQPAPGSGDDATGGSAALPTAPSSAPHTDPT